MLLIYKVVKIDPRKVTQFEESQSLADTVRVHLHRLIVTQSYDCQCNKACKRFNNCCSDYKTQCDNNVTANYVTTNDVTDVDLIEISERIGSQDTNNASLWIIMDIQNKTSDCNATNNPDHSKKSQCCQPAQETVLDNYQPGEY